MGIAGALTSPVIGFPWILNMIFSFDLPAHWFVVAALPVFTFAYLLVPKLVKYFDFDDWRWRHNR
jgi:hypothetical protein